VLQLLRQQLHEGFVVRQNPGSQNGQPIALNTKRTNNMNRSMNSR
jgi:hypothetical protein